MSKYDAKSMTISTTFEGIQMHPGQYIGSADINGLHHLLKEGISNSVDEFLNNHCSAIKVYYYDDSDKKVTRLAKLKCMKGNI